MSSMSKVASVLKIGPENPLLTTHPPTPAGVLPGGTTPEYPRRDLASLGAGSRSLAGAGGGALPGGTTPEDPRRDLASLGAGSRSLAGVGGEVLPGGTTPEYPRRDLASLGAGSRSLAGAFRSPTVGWGRRALGVGLLSFGLVACGGQGAQGAPTETPGGGEPVGDGAAPSTPSAGGDPAAGGEPEGPPPPDFELESLKGESIRLSDHLGKDVVLLDFWATFCDPCLAAMPHLDELYKKHKDDGFVIFGISIDGPDSVAQVKAEVAKLGVTFPILLDQESRVVKLYNPKTSAPYSVLIGKNGGIIAKKEGYTTGDSSSIDRDVEAALGK